MVFSAMLGGLGLMVLSFEVMAMRDVSVMVSLSVLACLVSLGCFVMVSGRLLVVVGKFLARHSYALDVANLRQPIDAVLSSRLRVHAEPFVGSSSVDLYRTAISGRASSRER
jgi:hypothetical protein